jgi:integrase
LGPCSEEPCNALPNGFTPHQLRHTCASILRSQGADVKAIQMQLGQSSPSVTLNVYTHLFGGDLDRLYEDVDAAHRDASSHSHGALVGPSEVSSVVPLR